MDCLAMLITIAKDHLKDGQMLIDYTKECKYNRDEDGFDFFKEEAEKRIEDYDDLHCKIQDIVNCMTDQTAESVEWTHIKQYHIDWVCSMQNCLAHLKY